jgi:hypothetical protein
MPRKNALANSLTLHQSGKSIAQRGNRNYFKRAAGMLFLGW